MSHEVITTYLNDHVAGSVAAVELLDHLIDLHSGADRELLTELRTQVQEDQRVLQQLLHTLDGKESPIRKAAAWLTERLGQVKLRIDDTGNGELRMLEAFETLALGIQGKLSLWRALAAVGDRLPVLASLDLSRLQMRASDQFNRVERLRLKAAERALSP